MDSPSFITKVLNALLSILPTNPLQPIIAELEVSEWLGYINYFVPVGTLLAIGTSWLTAIGIFYLYQVILRWAKVIGS